MTRVLMVTGAIFVTLSTTGRDEEEEEEEDEEKDILKILEEINKREKVIWFGFV